MVVAGLWRKQPGAQMGVRTLRRWGNAVESAIGYMPAVDAIEPPAGVSAEDMKTLLSVDVPGWKSELQDIRSEHYPKFGSKLPKELADQLEALTKRLG